ncbi:translocation/assembly module TamB domain-containing protein [Bergeyella sp. RCAD1439]|uniref:translocation/assembly module TamB domain-containing protein n=1 Tax=Bergeyella anatis TaxID=3113737 RepID=UPI002E18139B|nr:translocation/assembly module TamB [Bergeyella sp. RCAD1439]
MANLENNNENQNNKSLPGQIGQSVKKGVENLQDTLKDAAGLAKDAVNHPVETAEEFVEQAAKDVTSLKWWAKILLYFFWISLALIATAVLIVNLNPTKQWAAKQALEILNQDFKAKMTTESIHVDYFGDVTIKGLKIKDERDLDFIKVKEFRANSDWFRLVSSALSPSSNSLSFNSLVLDNADIKIITYKGDSISNFIKYIGNFESDKPADPKRNPFQLNARVHLINSKVSIVNQNKSGDQGRWLQADRLNLVAPSVKINGSNVSAQVNNFSFHTKRWGKSHFVETFSGEIALTKEFLALKDLTFNTDHSLLQGNLKFLLNPKTKWQDFNNKVRWELTLKQGSQISGYDLSYFMTQWDNHTPLNISGTMRGPLNRFTLNNFVIGNRDVSIATSAMRMNHLLDGQFVIETNHLNTDFTYKDLKAMLPSFISKKMKNFADDFGRLRYNGALHLTPKQITIPKAQLITGVGKAEIKQFRLSDYSTPLPKYKGYVEVENLNAATITKMPQVGLISGNFQLDGQSFDLERMKIETRSEIKSIEILGKTIRNLRLNGLLNEKTYQGHIAVNDPQAVAEFNGFINFKTAHLIADVSADIRHLNLNYFASKPGNQTFSGKIDGQISLSNLNDLYLDTALNDIRFASEGRSYRLPQAHTKVYFANGNRIVEVLAPQALNGRIAGQYQLEDLSGMLSNALNKILIGPSPKKIYRNQNFNIELEVHQELVNYFLPEIKIPHGATVSGTYEGSTNQLALNLDTAKLIYLLRKTEQITEADRELAAKNPLYKIPKEGRQSLDSLTAENLTLKINTANAEEQIFARINRMHYQQNILKDIVLTGRNENNHTLHFSTSFLHGSPEDEKRKNLKSYALNFNQTTNAQGDYLFRFAPTEINFNNVAWKVDTDEALNHSITYRKKSGDFILHNLRFFSGESSLLISEARFKSGKDFHAEGQIQQFQIGKLLEMQQGGNSMALSGIANGAFNLTMKGNNLEPLVDLKVDQITMNGKAMGDITLKAKNSPSPNVFDIEGVVASTGILGRNNLHVTGTVNNNTSTPTLDIKADMKDFDLAFSQEFVKSVFGNLRGKASGILSISGPINDIDYSGDIDLKNFGLKLNFIGVDYTFEDTTIALSKGRAILNNIRVKDGRETSSGSISGVIDFETLASMAVNLIMRADNLMVLNTQQKDFDLFWGRVYGQGNLYVSGPVSGLTIATDLNDPFRALNNSMFTFNAGSTSGVDEFKMLRFLREDEEGKVTAENRKKTGVNMTLDFNIAVDKGTTVNVALPENVGSISVRGQANPLRFRMFPNGNIAMNGSYHVDNGTFVSQAILERTFQIQSGSLMRWDGDAMTPELGIKANYMRAVTNAGQYLGTTLPPVNILLSVDITGTLNDPKIALGIDAPDLSSQLKETLNNKMINEDEKVIQFGSVLVLNSFNVQNASSFDTNLTNTLENSGYNMLFKQLGSVLNTISNEFQVDLNYLKGDVASNTGDRANASVSFSLSPRVTVKTGLGVPISGGSQTTDYNYLSGEGIIEYDWSKKNDKTRLLRVYSKPSNIGLVAGNAGNTAANQSYGLGVVYGKSFNTIFRRKKKKKTSSPSSAVIDSAKVDSVR